MKRILLVLAVVASFVVGCSIGQERQQGAFASTLIAHTGTMGAGIWRFVDTDYNIICYTYSGVAISCMRLE